MPDTERKRIVIVTNEILGVVRTGGSGSANTFLSFALACMGHNVELIVTAPSERVGLDPQWVPRYTERRVGVRLLPPPLPGPAPGTFRLPLTVLAAIETDPPDVVLVDAWTGPAYMALRLRDVGLAFQDTTFVVICNGPTAWNYETDLKLPRSFPAFEIDEIERASIELADAVVSPSRFLLNWISERGWTLPRSFVAPNFTEWVIDGGPWGRGWASERLERIAFFGRFEERKGLVPFINALNALGARFLSGVELAFVGRETRHWSSEQIAAALSEDVKHRISALRFETDLDQPEAIAFLSQPGTVAVMPSVLDNSPMVVSECLEHGIPFLASRVGGIPELVKEEDHERALVEPTMEGIRAGLERMLTQPEAVQPVRGSFSREDALATWKTIVEIEPRTRERRHRTAQEPSNADFLLRCDSRDELDPNCLATLQRAQEATDADVVTCAMRINETDHYFLGEPHELGLVGNYYGLVALCRRSLLETVKQLPATQGDVDWLLYATLSLAGAKIVSVPRPLASTTRDPGGPLKDAIGSGTALAVARAFEKMCPPGLRELPRLAASLAARRPDAAPAPSISGRLRWIWQNEGPAGIASRLVPKRAAHALGEAREKARRRTARAS